MAGLLAGQTFESRLVGDPSLSQTTDGSRHRAACGKWARTLSPKDRRKLRHSASAAEICAASNIKSPIASAQVKSAIFSPAFSPKEKRSSTEPSASRNHTERMLHYFLVRTTRSEKGAIMIFGDQVPESRDFHIPGDLSSAAYWLVSGGGPARWPFARARLSV